MKEEQAMRLQSDRPLRCLMILALFGVLVAQDEGWQPSPLRAAEPGALPFVRQSARDPRYFDLSDGRPFLPIGLNMIAPPREGMPGLERWFERLSANGGNFVRIWLGHTFFDVEHERSGQYDAARAERIDAMLALARRHGIRVKLCLEYFRHVGEGSQAGFGKRLHHVSQGGLAEKTADFFDTPAVREQFRRKLAWFQNRYGDDPIVFAWELWNEVDCIQGGDWAAWSDAMLPELHRLFPKNLATQSLGSFDHLRKRESYRRLCAMADNDVLQVHRYLDLGATLPVCRGPADVLAADAVRELLAFKVSKPVLLAESGAVEPSHSGPFKLYAKDKNGILLHDVLFAPFFAGAAGPGHIWHWDVYVDRLDLWRHFGRFARAVENVDPPAERFDPREVAHARVRVLALKGRTVLLAWCRDKQNTWQSELAEDRAADRLEKVALDLTSVLDRPARSARVYDPWSDRWTEVTMDGPRVVLPPFTRSVVLKVVLGAP